jgi:uncharacterized membrane protein HdeD (DUF308 family)
MIGVLARNWWALALRGLFAVLFGLLAFALPGLTLAALVILFGAYSLVDGIFALITAVRAAEAHERWWLFVLEGLAGVAAGLITFMWPGITALVLLFLIAWWAIITGIFEIAAAVRLRKEISGEWALALGGVASVIFGLLLLFRPGVGVLAVIWLIGTYAVVFGLLLLMLAFRLRGHPGQKPALA